MQWLAMTILNTLNPSAIIQNPASAILGLAAEKRYTSEISPSNIRVHKQYTCIIHNFSYVNLVVSSTEKAAEFWTCELIFIPCKYGLSAAWEVDNQCRNLLCFGKCRAIMSTLQIVILHWKCWSEQKSPCHTGRTRCLGLFPVATVACTVIMVALFWCKCSITSMSAPLMEEEWH